VGYAFSSVDELGNGVVRKIRPALEISAFAWVLAPGVESRPHSHEEQDELYFIHRGRARFRLPGKTRELGPGGLCHVEAATPRQIVSVGDEDLVLIVIGAKGGYVGRDGQPADPAQLG
jgi:mannose-6-phosphate isomerase-like protein (cupin superfamily)